MCLGAGWKTETGRNALTAPSKSTNLLPPPIGTWWGIVHLFSKHMAVFGEHKNITVTNSIFVRGDL